MPDRFSNAISCPAPSAPTGISTLLRRAAASFCALGISLLLTSAPAALAQEDAPPPPAKKGVQIAFIPPPMEGSLSLGIYDKKGKLVRVLAREATPKDFTVGLNGLITNWDGRDNNGKALPAGAYSARGFSVGGLDVEGVAFHGNDWMTADDSPRLRRILSLGLTNDSKLTASGEGVDGKPHAVRLKEGAELSGEIPGEADPKQPRAVVEAGKVAVIEGEKKRALNLPNLTTAIDACLGREGRVWVIDQSPERIEVKEFGVDGEFHRRLSIDAGEPAPKRVFASRTSELIFLIEEKPGLQRVRGLALESAGAPGDNAETTTSTWKTVLSKAILTGDTFAAVSSQLDLPKAFSAEEQFSVRLLPNPLLKDESSTVRVNVSHDNTGSFLQSADGLPLRRLTETPNLKWVVIGHESGSKQLTILQSDGAVIEEFRARKLANMMAFDAGDYEWAGK